ncbi:MAG TPA: hypothetical protein VG245_09695, partial [Candidatus Dormibacteraeota bacterium]|nr:hypothetical protein [Candidatus Dormibacteraeota bacterium]
METGIAYPPSLVPPAATRPSGRALPAALGNRLDALLTRERLADALIVAVGLGGLLTTWLAVASGRLHWGTALICCGAAMVAERLKVAVSDDSPVAISLSLAVI